MPKKQQTRVLLTDTKVKAAQPEGTVVRIWDTKVSGFHLRITPAGSKSFCVTFQRPDGKKVNVTLGSAEAWPVDDPKAIKGDPRLLDANGDPKIGARTWAERLRTQHDQGKDVRVTVKAVRASQDLRALVKIWREDYRPSLKPTTQISYDSLLKDKGEGKGKAKPRVGPILSILGARQVKDLSYADVKELHRKVRQGRHVAKVKGADPVAKTLHHKDSQGGHITNANRAVAVLSRLMSIAEQEGWRPQGTNPCTHFKKSTEKPRSRVLGFAEYRALEQALVVMESASAEVKSSAGKERVKPAIPAASVKKEKPPECLQPQVADLIRFLALSGLRKSEALGLRFQDVDLERGVMRFEEHKTSVKSGTKVLPLNSHLRAIIHRRAAQRLGPFVFPGWKSNGPIVGLAKMWIRVAEVAGLQAVTPHDLRRTFMSTSMELGYPAAIGDALLGHSLGKIRDTYIHLGSQGIMAMASQEVADWTAAAMAGEGVKPGVKVAKVAKEAQ